MCVSCQLIIVDPSARQPTDRQPQLGDREIQIVVAWVLHDTKTAAAKSLYVAPSTVKTTIQRVRAKYHTVGRPAPTQVALLIRLLQDNIVDVDGLRQYRTSDEAGY